MTSPRSPRFALALLERVVPDSAPLAGDLLEEFARGRSRAWVWKQVVAAVLHAWLHPSDEIRPIHLVTFQPDDALERSRRLSRRSHAVNLTASPIHGVGGLGLMMLCLLVSIVVPAVWWVFFASIIAGLGLGAAMIARHERAALRR
jgi:hypothetical protein